MSGIHPNVTPSFFGGPETPPDSPLIPWKPHSELVTGMDFQEAIKDALTHAAQWAERAEYLTKQYRDEDIPLNIICDLHQIETHTRKHRLQINNVIEEVDVLWEE